jgi:hypothetical protein
VAGHDKVLFILNLGRKMHEPKRNLFCRHYSSCLSVFVRCGKPHFECTGCRQYLPQEIEPQDTAEDRVACLKFLNELFFGLDPFEVRGEMKKTFSDDELVTVPTQILRGLVFSFAQAQHYLGAVSNLINRLNQILGQGNPGKAVADPGTCSEPQTIAKETNHG